jgi:hypothetical protein
LTSKKLEKFKLAILDVKKVRKVKVGANGKTPLTFVSLSNFILRSLAVISTHK